MPSVAVCVARFWRRILSISSLREVPRLAVKSMEGFLTRVRRRAPSATCSRSEPQDPRRRLALGAVVSGVLWIAVNGWVPAPWSNTGAPVLAGLFALFFGSIVAIRVNDFINHRNQRRNWRQEYALSRVRDIYGPLYDETSALLGQLEIFEDVRTVQSFYGPVEPKIGGFVEISQRHFGIFLDEQAKTLLRDFHLEAERYRAHRGQAWDAYLRATDRAEDVANVLEGVVLKNT